MPQLSEREAVAKRQDLSNTIHVADMKKTPFTSSVKKGTNPTNTLVEWPVDNYPAPSSEGAVDEQDAQNFENLGAPDAVLQTRLQIWERKPKVSRLAELAANQAGIGPKRAFAKSVAKSLVMIKRDMEFTSLGDNESRIGTSSQGMRMRGLGKWIQSTAQTDLPVPEDYRPPAASISTTNIADISDDTLTGVVQSMYDQTGDDDMQLTGWCGSRIKRALSRLTMYGKTETGLTLARRYNQPAESGKVTMKVDVLETDYGTIFLRLASFINTGGDHTSDASKRLCYLTPMNDEAMRLRFAENPNNRELENAGGGRRGITEAIGTLEVGNPLWFGKLAPAA